MRRLLVMLTVLTLAAVPVGAQHAGHHVSTPDTLKWIEPPTFPGAKLAIVEGDPGKGGPFVYRVKFPAEQPHFAWAGGGETLVQVHGVGPTDIRFINPADDPRNKK